jgi:hypothetical protein
MSFLLIWLFFLLFSKPNIQSIKSASGKAGSFEPYLCQGAMQPKFFSNFIGNWRTTLLVTYFLALKVKLID